MLNKFSVTLVVCFLLSVSALHTESEHQQTTLKPGKINLKSDNGKYLARCTSCGPATQIDSASVVETDKSQAKAIWTLQKVGDKVAFKADNGKYLASCNKCWKASAYPNPAFVYATSSSEASAQFTPELQIDTKKWVFKSDSGKFLARCHKCVVGGTKDDFAFIYTALATTTGVQWTVEEVSTAVAASTFPYGTVNIQADTGKYLARCNGCGPAKYPDSAGVHATSPSPAWATWTAQKVGDKVAFKSDTGKYLGRCENCWKKAAYPNAAFIHAPNSSPAYAQWTPQLQSNGKWALKADSGKYLARCQGCVAGGAKSDFAFVHVSSPDAAYAQWKVTNK